MKKTIKEFCEETELSQGTIRRIFAAGKVKMGDRIHPAKMDEDKFKELAEKLGVEKFRQRRRTGLSIQSIFFDSITPVVIDEYGTLEKFFDQTGFNKQRWYSLASSRCFLVDEKENEILRGLLNV